MNGKYTRFVSFIGMLIVLLTLAACGGPSRVTTRLQQVQQYYTDGVRLETSWTEVYADVEQTYSSGLLNVLDQNVLANECFVNVREVVDGVLVGTFDTGSDSEGNPNGRLDQDAFINALALNETYPDLARCQDAKRDVMRQVSIWRQNNMDKLRTSQRLRREYTNFLNDDIKKRVINEAVETMSERFPQFGIPVDFIGFPTDNLQAETRDQGICVYYQQEGATNGNYVATWNPALRVCTLKRMAAYEYMSRLFISAEASQRFDCGQDAGAFAQTTDNCGVVEPTPATIQP